MGLSLGSGRLFVEQIANITIHSTRGGHHPLFGPRPPLSLCTSRSRQIEGQHRRTVLVLPFGLAEVDSRLPVGGLSLGALHEVAGGGKGSCAARSEIAIAFS